MRRSLFIDVDMDVSKYSGYKDYKWAVELNRLNLTLLGIWPKNNESKRNKVMSNIRVIVIFNIAIWGCCVPCLHSLFRISNDIMSMIDNLQYTLPCLMAVIKFFIIWRKKEDFLPLLNMIKHDWLKRKTAEERNVMIKRARIARMLTIFGWLIMLLSFTLCVMLPIFGISIRYITNQTDPGRLMPLQTYYLYDRDKSPFYEITYFMQAIGMSAIGSMYTSTDSFLGALIFHVCGQLENLRARIVNFDKFDKFEKALLYNVEDHKRLIRSVNIIDNTFNLMLLGALFYFGIIFAFFGFLLSMIINQGRDLSIARLIFTVTANINIFAHTCLYCAEGEILVAQCDGIYDAVCEYKWYTLQSREARNLLIIMIRASKSLHLTAGKLFPMNMSTFCNLLKTSGGYISVLLAYRQ